jgi:DNA polymerase-3 subunit gamma/tau
MSLYRKYRPQTFADVVGQEHIVTTLENAVSQDKLSHAYLFSGSRGTGKTSIARILAKHLLTQGITDEVLKRQIQTGVTEGTIVDLIEIDAASNTGVDNIRDLIEKVQFSPVAASAKVYIIDEVHMLSKGAFNALLKTLEEPPAYAFFILATTELHKIPPTIQSRCLCFSFRQIREDDIIRRLQYIADQERITVDRLALRAIARHAAGGMRDAISLLDQLRSMEKITAEDVQERIGESGHEYVEALFTALDTGNESEILRIVAALEDNGIPLDTFLRQLLGAVRDRLHAAVAEGDRPDTLIRTLDVLLTAIRDVRVAPVPGLILESALLSLCAPADSSSPVPPKAASSKANKQQQAFAPAAGPMGTEKQPQPKTKKEEAKDIADHAKEKATAPSLIQAPELTLEAAIAVWPQIVAQANPPALKMSLKNGRVTAINDKTLTLIFVSKFHRDRVAQKEALYALEALLQQHFKQAIRLECVLGEEKDIAPIENQGMVNLAEAVSEIF